MNYSVEEGVMPGEDNQVVPESIIGTPLPIECGRSERNNSTILWKSRVHPDTTFVFTYKNADVIRCQQCLTTNKKLKKDKMPTQPVPYIRVDGGIWSQDPDYPNNPHFCVERKLVSTATSKSLSHQLYRAEVRSLSINLKRPKEAHNDMISKVSEVVSGNPDLHLEVNEDLPSYEVARRTFNRQKAASFLNIDTFHTPIPQELQELPDRSESVLSVTALLPTKDTADYKLMFQHIRDALLLEFGDTGVAKVFHFDMEPAAMNAAKQVFRNSTVKSCYFHFSKNVMDKVATLGLKAIYDRSTNASFCTWIRTFIGSAQAPNSYWHLILDYLRENMPQSYEPAENAKIRQLFQYFNDYWARYRNSWSHFDNDGPRTTNHAEGWHNHDISSFAWRRMTSKRLD
ncbi:hypothetical protein QR680_000408 [Steinernema hermaphroditum]|uniref:MULE transposase domain-containing protein n=1 Tax=Steinernema hermaphroditum TaxID=289476 RepID=A0AA39LE02_9BILA|nr:hypothetical protein QR680_000408 [Steinernema hermaphroditum]